MPSLWFVTPAHGRLELARICLRQLRRTCDALIENGVEATAVVISCDENLDTARELGFGTIERDNRFVSRRFNDGIQLACDPAYNPRPADYVVPCGSDDWVDWRLYVELPPPRTMYGFQNVSFVRPDGREMVSRFVNYPGGSGIRIYPRQLMEAVSYRPADEDRKRGCDTSILVNVQRSAAPFHIEHRRSDARQIVDWKSATEQLNGYEQLARYRETERGDPFEMLADVFPAEALEEMSAHYGLVPA